jgi:hypothetical protein
MKKIILTIVLLAGSLLGCETLDEKVYSELTPAVLNSESGALSLLNSAYSNATLVSLGNGGVQYYYLSAMPSGEAWNAGGNIEAILSPLSNFTWDSNLSFFSEVWRGAYASIRDANLLITHIPNTALPDDFKNRVVAEATFLRAFSYTMLHNWFGPVPLITETTSEYHVAKSSEEELRAFVEKDLLFAANGLPAKQPDAGRASKGAALGVLAKFYLNTRQWQKTVETTRQIIASGEYQLLDDYARVFALDNEGNKELLWVLPRHAQGGAIFLNALTFPTDYPLLPNQGVYAARTYMYDEFVNSFETSDVRRKHFVTEYTNTAGQHLKLLGKDQTLSLKYEFDPTSSGPGTGNDFPIVRYSDVLLSLAEALNEVDGPVQESLDLLNTVRTRAHASLIPFAGQSQESLRALIHKEREWEFFAEAKNREDQIRRGNFVSKAVNERNKSAKAHHVLFPIPETELNANPNLKQNDGY